MGNGKLDGAISDVKIAGTFVRRTGPTIVNILLALLAVFVIWSSSRERDELQDRYTRTQAKRDWTTQGELDKQQNVDHLGYTDKEIKEHVDSGPHAPMPVKMASLEATMAAMKNQLDRIEARLINDHSGK